MLLLNAARSYTAPPGRWSGQHHGKRASSKRCDAGGGGTSQL